ncbi:hypothetical protein GCM10010429_21870 [Micromonospora olivasterospora]
MRYDVLVIGSGFGGSVTALRLAEKGYSVGVLEAGRRFADDEFPAPGGCGGSCGRRGSAATGCNGSTCSAPPTGGPAGCWCCPAPGSAAPGRPRARSRRVAVRKGPLSTPEVDERSRSHRSGAGRAGRCPGVR